MSISSISGGSTLAALQAARATAASATTRVAQDDPSTTGMRKTDGVGRFAAALGDALASLGISLDSTSTTATSGTTGDDATTDTSDAFGTFVQSLFAALHGQSAGSAPPPPPPDDDGSSTAGVTRGAGGPPPGGGLEADLQSLIQALGSTSSDTTDTSATTASGDATLATLEKTFDALVAKSGGSTTDDADSLTSFLKALATHLHGAPATGNIVSTEA